MQRLRVGNGRRTMSGALSKEDKLSRSREGVASDARARAVELESWTPTLPHQSCADRTYTVGGLREILGTTELPQDLRYLRVGAKSGKGGAGLGLNGVKPCDVVCELCGLNHNGNKRLNFAGQRLTSDDFFAQPKAPSVSVVR